MSKASNLLSRLSETVYSGSGNIGKLETALMDIGWGHRLLMNMAKGMSRDEYEDKLAQILNDHEDKQMKMRSRNAPYEEETA